MSVDGGTGTIPSMGSSSLHDDTPGAYVLADLPDLQQELYFGLVRAIGTPLKQVVKHLIDALHNANFDVYEIRLADQLKQTAAGGTLAGSRGSFLYYDTRMAASDLARSSSGRKDVLALLAVQEMEARRLPARTKAIKDGRRGVAYIFRSLMHPHEVRVMRELYKSQFFLVSVFSPEQDRRKHLSELLAKSEGRARSYEHDPQASQLIFREQGFGDPAIKFASFEHKASRINIPRTFQLGDLFLTQDSAREEIARFIELVFSNPHRVPSVEESCMANAYNAATTSGNLARQVGAAICTELGDVLALGSNDVPRPNGGIYRTGIIPNHSDVSDGVTSDSSDEIRRSLLVDFLVKLFSDRSWVDHLISKELRPPEVSAALDVVNTFLESEDGLSRVDFHDIATDLIRSPLISEAQLFDVIEYSRTLHAEMHAITTAARLGIPIRGARLYCTTFPCHECARLILGSGISTVYFVEPYGKSRVAQLYSTEISLATERNTPRSDTIQFRPFIGVSPLRLNELFSWIDRKVDDHVSANERTLTGAKMEWHLRTADLRHSISSPEAFGSKKRLDDVRDHEQKLLQLLKPSVDRMNLIIGEKIKSWTRPSDLKIIE